MKTESVIKWENLFDSRLNLMNRDYSIDDWSNRSDDYSESRKTGNYQYGRAVYQLLSKNGIVSSSSQMIEIGSGPGTFVIPFAEKIHHVTAIEPADGMIEKIKENASQAGVSNFNIIPKIWQDVDTNCLFKSHDLVISSTVIWMFRDICKQIHRMEEISSGYCCLCAGIDSMTNQGNNNSDDLWIKMIGNTQRPLFPEYPLIYSILYENGIYPEIRMIEHTSRRTPENMMKMYFIFYNLFTELTPEKKEIINQHVMKNLKDDGKFEMKFKTAVLWWKSRCGL